MPEVACHRCGKPVPGAPPGARLALCLTCQVLMDAPAPQTPSDLATKRRVWPWLVAGVVIAGGVAGFFVWQRHNHEQDVLDMKYPLHATGAQEAYLAEHVGSWKAGRDALPAALAAFDPRSVTEGTGACALLASAGEPPAVDDPVGQDALRRELQHDDPDELVEAVFVIASDLPKQVAAQIETIVAAGERARFHTVRGARRILRVIGMPLVVVMLSENKSASVVAEPQAYGIGKSFSFEPGHRTGVAYAFDPATGKLACAGQFEASSSEKISAVTSSYQGIGGDSGNLEQELAADMEDRTLEAIRASLHPVR